MVSLDVSFERALERQYAQAPADLSFADVMAAYPVGSEDDLADLIELDGRQRIALGRPVELRRYLQAVADLNSSTVALDAAIDVTLRSMSQGRRPDTDAVRTLILNYPQFERAIRDAAVLGRSMLSTTDVYRAIEADLPARLPCDFGPVLPDGRARYELQALIGAGGAGAVYRATDRQLSEPDAPAIVAIKLMRFRDRSPWARQRFVEEATKARRIVHPNVARVLDRGIAGGETDYIVYEHIDGGDLQSWFRGPLPERQAAAITAKIARAIHAAHLAGLVHCDLKPSNILLTAAAEPKVTDFGIAVRATCDVPEASPSEPARPLGSLAFAAPEQLRMEEGSLAIPADVYALGGILFYLLTGRYPNGQSREEVLSARDNSATTPSARQVRPGIDADLDAIARRAMTPAPAGRHSSAAELASDLDDWLAHRPIPWARPSPLRILRLWSRRRPIAVGAVLIVVLAVAASATVAYRSWSAARATAAEAQVSIERLQRTQGEVGRVYQLLKLLQAQHFERDLLPTIMALEWVTGQKVLGTSETRSTLWQDRLDIVSGIVERADAEGRAGDVEVLTWQSALAFWLVNDGRFEEAAPVLADNIARWSAVAGPEDGWLVKMKAISAAADVQRLAAAGSPPDKTAGSPIRLAEAALLDADRLFKGQSAGTPIHALVLRTLVTLYGNELLNSPKDHRKFERRLKDATG
jgi:hypothetical protein